MEECRLCYCVTNPELSRNIFDTKLEPPIWFTVKQLTNLIIEKNDPYTKFVCLQCFEQLEKINTFRQTILKADCRFRNNQQLDNNINNSDNFVCCTTIKLEGIDYNLKEEPNEITEEEEEEDPLKIEKLPTDDLKTTKSDQIGITEVVFSDNSNETRKLKIDDDVGEAPIKDTKLHQCDICKKTFQCKSRLLRHARIHTGEKPYQCDICKSKFTQLGHLQKHLRLHTGIKQFECTDCHRKFSDKNHLIVHKRIHTGEKPYQCTICQQRFRHLCTFKKHSTVHSGEKLYQCTICEQKFSYRQNLTRHLSGHTGEKLFNCDVCEKRFKTNDNLQIHQRIHTGERPYQCTMCNRSFAQKSRLNDHLRLHTGERPYQCDFCDKNFVQNSALRKHYKRIHSN